MTSNKQRREVAARLRNSRRRDRESQITFIARMVKGRDIVTAADVCRIPKLLADLIDRPTCEDVSVPRGDGFTPYVEFKCSACGCSHVSLTYVYYCPNCGAEVTDDD